MSKIAIVSDSTHYLPKEYIEKYNIKVVPLTLIWGDETFLDGVDIQPSQFYERLAVDPINPSTSQPAIGDMHAVFSELVEQDYEVFAVVISKLLSGTYNSAVQGREMLGDKKEMVTIFDSGTISLETGFQILAAAEVIEKGGDMAAVVAAADNARDNSGVYFVCDTLDYLARGGRLSKEEAAKGNELKIKPILTIAEGKITTAERVKTKSKAVERAAELVLEAVEGHKNVKVGVFHANALAEANETLKLLTGPLGLADGIIADVSPVIGTHTGPKTIGLSYVYES